MLFLLPAFLPGRTAKKCAETELISRLQAWGAGSLTSRSWGGACNLINSPLRAHHVTHPCSDSLPYAPPRPSSPALLASALPPCVPPPLPLLPTGCSPLSPIWPAPLWQLLCSLALLPRTPDPSSGPRNLVLPPLVPEDPKTGICPILGQPPPAWVCPGLRDRILSPPHSRSLGLLREAPSNQLLKGRWPSGFGLPCPDPTPQLLSSGRPRSRGGDGGRVVAGVRVRPGSSELQVPAHLVYQEGHFLFAHRPWVHCRLFRRPSDLSRQLVAPCAPTPYSAAVGGPFHPLISQHTKGPAPVSHSAPAAPSGPGSRQHEKCAVTVRISKALHTPGVVRSRLQSPLSPTPCVAGASAPAFCRRRDLRLEMRWGVRDHAQ